MVIWWCKGVDIYVLKAVLRNARRIIRNAVSGAGQVGLLGTRRRVAPLHVRGNLWRKS